MSAEAANQVFNIGADQPYSVNELAECVAAAMGVQADIVHKPARNEVLNAYSSHEKVRARLRGAAADGPGGGAGAHGGVGEGARGAGEPEVREHRGGEEFPAGVAGVRSHHREHRDFLTAEFAECAEFFIMHRGETEIAELLVGWRRMHSEGKDFHHEGAVESINTYHLNFNKVS